MATPSIVDELLELHPGLPDTRRFEYVWAILIMETPGKVLDLGCNGSILDLYLKKRGFDCWCIDKDPDAAYYATRVLREPSRFIIHDFIKPLPEYLPQFNYITIISTIEHLDPGEDKIVLKNAKSYLAPEGKILITVPHGEGYQMQGRWAVKCYTYDSMEELVSSQNLRIRSYKKTPKFGDLPLFCVEVVW